MTEQDALLSPTPSQNTRTTILLAILAVGSVLLFVERPVMLDGPTAFLSLMVIWVGLAPGLWRLRHPGQKIFPILPLFGFFHSVYFGLSFFTLQEAFPNAIDGKIRIYAVWPLLEINPLAPALVLCGLLAFFGTYSLFQISLGQRLSGLNFVKSMPLVHAKVLAWALLAVYMAAKHLPVINTLPSMGQGAEMLHLVVFGGLYVLILKSTTSLPEKIAYFLSLALDLYLRLSIGLFSGPAVLVLFLFVVHWRVGRSLPIKSLLFVVVLLGLVYEPRTGILYDKYGQIAIQPSGEQGGYFDPSLIAAWAERTVVVTYQYWAKTGWGYKHRKAGSRVLKRVSYGVLFSHVIDVAGRTAPQWGGESYHTVIGNLVPRALWPDKPKEEFGARFGHDYHLLKYSDDKTSVNLAWLVEAYVNYGALGVPIVMGFIGLFMGLANHLLNNPSMPLLAHVMGAGLIFRLAFPESNFSLMTGSLVMIVALLFVYWRVGGLVLRRVWPLDKDAPQ